MVDALDQPVADMHRRQLGHLAPEALRTLSDLLEAARREGGGSDAPSSGAGAAKGRLTRARAAARSQGAKQ